MRVKNIAAGIAGLVAATGIVYELYQIMQDRKEANKLEMSISTPANGPKVTTYSKPTNLEMLASNQKASDCDENLWNHVYHPQRLQILERCKTVTGTIDHIKPEPDGDLHIRLRLDPQYGGMLNEKNMTVQHGCLVIEPVCVKEITQQDAIDACMGFNSTVRIPKKGDHVRVTGAYILDKPHGWTELHPVTSIEVIQ